MYNLQVKNFSNKGTDMSLRVASLDYLGVVAARLRRDTVLSRCKVNTIDQMIKDIKSEEMKDGESDFSKVYIITFLSAINSRYKCRACC